MKKILISLMIGISITSMAGCSSDEMKSAIKNNTTIVEQNNIIDDFILKQRSNDMETLVDYINGKITLNNMKEHFTVFGPYWVKNYKDLKNITEEQEQFCIDYIDFCDGMVNYYPSDEPLSEVIDKLISIYDSQGYTSDRVVQWEKENK